MKTDSVKQARGHPVSTDREKILLSEEAGRERRNRAKYNRPDTTFRQAERKNSFEAREDVFATDIDGVQRKNSIRLRQKRLRRSYAKDVRHELGEENDSDQHGGILTRASGREGSQSTVSKGRFYTGNGPKNSAFYVGMSRAKNRRHLTEAVSYAGRNTVISQKDSLFYAGDDDLASTDAVRRGIDLQRRLIRKNYQRAPEASVYIPFVSRIRERAKARSGQATLNGGKSAARKLAEFFEEHPVMLIAILLTGLLVMLIGSAVSGGTMLITHTVAPASIATTYTAEDEDIKGADQDYQALEAELSGKVDNLETYYPGYSSYELSAGQIGHDPYKLAALLTVLHEDYKREDVQEDLQRIFDMQYNLSISESLAEQADTEEAESKKLTATLKNYGLDHVAEQLLTKDEKERYDLLVETKGNKPDLFAADIYANSGAGWFDYTIAGDALSDQKFAGMMAEAKKYLGYPYVWGGSSPSTSFDCSGFVCWVINHSGNGWNVGRTTANGLCSMLPKVSPSEAKPGDIIFFQGTYPTAGASHVGIYLGNNMMIHCGEPIQYANISTPYWKQHFYCFGRLPSN